MLKRLKLEKVVMETLVKKEITTLDGETVVIGGYPDMLVNDSVIVDWKINGYYSRARTSLGKGPVYVCGNCTGRERCRPVTDFSQTQWFTQLQVYSYCTGIETGVIHQAAFHEGKARWAEYKGRIPLLGLVEKVTEVHRELKNPTMGSDLHEIFI
jgi:hypothetical protein